MDLKIWELELGTEMEVGGPFIDCTQPFVFAPLFAFTIFDGIPPKIFWKHNDFFLGGAVER